MTLSLSILALDTEHCYAECCILTALYAECSYAECHYADCRSTECRGACTTSQELQYLFKKVVSATEIACHMLSLHQGPTLQNVQAFNHNKLECLLLAIKSRQGWKPVPSVEHCKVVLFQR